MPAASNLDFDRRIASWKTLLSVRASDNRVFVAACNSDGRATLCASPDGNVMDFVETEGYDIYDIDSSLYDRYRSDKETMQNIRYQAHRRPELYQ